MSLVDGLRWKARHSIHPRLYILIVEHGSGRRLAAYHKIVTLEDIREPRYLELQLIHMQKRILFELRKS